MAAADTWQELARMELPRTIRLSNRYIEAVVLMFLDDLLKAIREERVDPAAELEHTWYLLRAQREA